MAIRRRQLAVVSLVMVLAAILIGGPLATPPSAVAQGDESFITPLTPGKLYADDASHDVVIPIPSSGLQGYCVVVSGEGHRAAGPTYGFHVDPAVGTIVYNPADPDAPNNPKYFDNGSATTTDDVYCVAVRANPRPAGNLPGEPMAPAEPLVIYWDYYDEAADRVFTVASDPIPVVTVRLVGFDGFIGGRALVCTEGWDPTFLTGATANAGATSNPLDDVRLADWTILTPGAVALGEPFLNTSDFTTQNPGGNPLPRPEWCLSLAGTAAINDVPVEFNFVAVYDTAHTGDDHDVTVNSTGAGIDFIGATEPELRHVNSAGHLVEGAVSINAIASSHTVCALPTSTHNGDTLDPVIIDGKLAQPLVDNDATNGIPDGTLCFRWSESTPKIQDISATIDFGGGGGWGPDVRAIWDTDGDGNGFRPGPTPDDIGRLLMKEWWRAHATRITTGPDYADPSTDVTDKRIDVPIIFNAGTGNFIGSVGLNEWVLGAPQEDPAPADLRPLDGVRAEFKLLPGRSGQNVCGYFEANGVALGAQEFDAPANAGRIEFKVNIAPGGAAKGCRPGDELLVTIDTFYGDDEPTGIPQETVRLRVGIDGRYDPPQAVPQLAWAGQKVEIFYGFAARSCIGLVATFVSPEDQPGAFIAPGHQQGAKAVRIPFDEDDCSATVHYVSPNPGVVDIIATFEDTDPVDGTISGDFSKVYFPLFFLAFEDLEVGSPGSLVVSEEGLLTAWVRGWFISANPSGRPEETKGDGRTLPADRWVLPDDWERLRGDANFRQWPSSAPMPPATVTFFMENEHIRNAYRSETEGGAGIFISDGDNGEFDWNINPVTRTPSVLGTAGRPRIVSENTDTGGAADTGIFGDYNLGFDECAVNRPTGNPHCAPGDIVGRTRYYAVVDYPEHRPNNPPVRSNTTETAFTWAGYKQLSVVDTENPGIKYVVAHLKDRDGFCNAISLHNVLGNTLQFQIDAGGGIIIDAANRPVDISLDKRGASAVTFDTEDDLGNPMNEEIAQPTMAADECQAWIKISNSLQTPANVMVTFPAPPAPLPGEVRVTQLVCGPGGYAMVTNLAGHPVSLEGFGLRSPGSRHEDEHLGLTGLLEPGESATFPGDSELAPWLNSGRQAFSGGSDFVALAWNEFEVSRMYCDGTRVNPDLPASYPLEGEGELLLDIIVPFGEHDGIQLHTGWNLVSSPGSGPVASVLGANASKVEVIYYWEPETQTWLRFVGEGPDFLDTLERFEAGAVYWVQVNQPFTLRMTR